jgi:hypothetical protein
MGVFNMSVWLIEDLTGFARLERGLAMFRVLESEFIQRSSEFSETRVKMLYQLHRMNVKTYNKRYPDDNQNEISDFNTFKKHANSVLSDDDRYKTAEQVLKSCRFLLYQIENDSDRLPYDEHIAMQWINSYISDITEYLLKKYTQIERADWGL